MIARALRPREGLPLAGLWVLRPGAAAGPPPPGSSRCLRLVQALVVANASDEPVDVARRTARPLVVEIGANQHIGADKGSVVEHEQRDRGGPVRGWRRARKQHRMKLIRMAAR